MPEPYPEPQLRLVPYDHPDARKLTELVQAEYVRLYGGPDGDSSPVDAAEFSPPRGRFHVGYVDDLPVTMGGWRWGGPRPGDAEIKRMYVLDEYRGRGYSRHMLRHLESTARVAGVSRLVLETGIAQPAAIGLYVSAGYAPIEPFGHYAGADDARHFARSLIDTPARRLTP